MMGSPTVYILYNLLTLCLTYAQYDHDDPGPTAGTCQNVNILMVHNSSTGMQILLTSTSNHTQNKSVDLPNHSLPPECENGHHCGILHFEHSGISYYIIPSISGFVVLSHTADNTGPTSTEDIRTSFINITEKCNPTQAFYAGPEGRYHIVIACMDLQTRPHGIIYYLQYYFSPASANAGRGSIFKNTNLLVQSETIYNPETVSEIIYVRKQERCAEYDNLYFIDNSYILHYPSDAFDPEFIPSNRPLHNCSNSRPSIEYYGNDSLLIQCSDNHGVLYDSCASQFAYPAPESVPYPCTNWDIIVYRNGSELTLNRLGRVTLKLPFNDLSFGKCVQGVDHHIFIASSADGSIFIAPFDGNSNNFTKITSGNCSKNKNTCRRPVFSKNQHVLGAFDPADNTVVVVNLMLTCMEQPFIMKIHAPFTPELMSISLRQGTFNCRCPDMLKFFDHTTAAEGISKEEITTIQPPTSLENLISVWVATVTAVLVIATVIVIVIMTVITYTHYKSRKFNNQENDTPFNFHKSAEIATVTDHDIALPHKEHCNSEKVYKNPDKLQYYVNLV